MRVGSVVYLFVMADVESVKNMKFPQISHEDEMKMNNHIKNEKNDLTCKNSSQIMVTVINDMHSSDLPNRMNLMMTRCLNFCRKIPGMGLVLAFLASLFFSIDSLAVKFVQVNPLVVVISQ